MTKVQPPDRKDRLAAALRANLKRRKEKDRALTRAEASVSSNLAPERPKTGAKPS
ncbi:MAG TPA: hypothetical protein VHL34_24455 [Rhizomicrobium sp.]|nr:hypothetical protein [Rhizomicrobium sp.]